ncbi:MAG: DnaJ domain-containing protein [Polyangiales bacterium]|nr:DnaJ domain-containing protein [Myxococcales bacterium]
MTVPEPIAQGDLAQKPFAHLLLYLEQRAMSGTLAIWPADSGEAGQDRVLILDGRPTSARWRSGIGTLEKGLLELFARAKGPYAFYAADLVGTSEGVVSGRIDSHALLVAAIRAGSLRDDVVNALLARYGQSKLRIRLGTDLQRFRFQAKEDAFVQVLRAAPGTVDELARISGSPRLAKQLLYVLTITQSVEPYEGTTQALKSSASGVLMSPLASGSSGHFRVPSSTGLTKAPTDAQRSRTPASGMQQASVPPPKKLELPPAPPSGLAPALKERWKAVADRVQGMENQNHFQMLGLSDSATGVEANEAYLKLAKDWHPDRFPPELASLKPWVDRIFHHMTTAKDVLSDDKERADHLKAIQAGGGTPESDRQVNAIVYAAMEFQKVEVLVRRREWDEALAILKQAMEMNDGEPDYHAMEAWILYNRHTNKSAPFPKMLAAADKAIALREEHERANFYKALILKRMGEEQKALRFFRKAAELNPRNIEAAREVRIASLRSEKEGSASNRIFSGLFGGKKKS